MAGYGTAHLRSEADTLLRVENLVVEFPAGRRGLKVNAVTDVSLDVRPGETLGLVGESGCGKSTTGKAIMQLPPPTSGRVMFDGTDLASVSGEELRRTRTQIQMIFQDPISSLNPRRRIEDIIAEGLNIWGVGDKSSRQQKVDEMLLTVGLDPKVARGRRPHQFSGGQCQRISIARAVITEPKLIICDEPVSALDVSVQAQILNLLEDMKARYGLTLVFIAHDLAVVKNISDRVTVMYLGRICEVGDPNVLTASRLIPTPPPCSAPSPSPIRRFARRTARSSAARSPPPCHLLAAAGSAPGAREPRNGARTRCLRCATWATASSWPVTSPSRRPTPPRPSMSSGSPTDGGPVP